jgi:DNA modification methylase
VLRECWRVLKDDGVMFWNIGDSYASNPAKGGSGTYNGRNGYGEEYGRAMRRGAKRADGVVTADSPRNRDGAPIPDGLKSKDLCLVPARFALAAQADGWYVRSRIIWAKRAPMPEPVMDRPTNATEDIYLLAKSERYYWDAEAVLEESVSDHHSGNGYKRDARLSYRDENGPRGQDNQWQMQAHRNMRNFWLLGPDPYSDPVLDYEHADFEDSAGRPHRVSQDCPAHGDGRWLKHPKHKRLNKLSCLCPLSFIDHYATFPREVPRRCILAGTTIGDIVLDPFGGSGTVGSVAEQLGLRWVSLELSSTYMKQARNRTAQVGLSI